MQLVEVIASALGSDDVYLAVGICSPRWCITVIVFAPNKKKNRCDISIMLSPAILEASAKFSFQAL